MQKPMIARRVLWVSLMHTKVKQRAPNVQLANMLLQQHSSIVPNVLLAPCNLPSNKLFAIRVLQALSWERLASCTVMSVWQASTQMQMHKLFVAFVQQGQPPVQRPAAALHVMLAKRQSRGAVVQPVLSTRLRSLETLRAPTVQQASFLPKVHPCALLVKQDSI